ncbi:N-acetyltransferase family protein [Egicoccus sp. AB-alg6-2]|uniref:GNAT family N-acetyltransferase n=1 Tax=Egicoccus sp. AB-alg6-2 TaxID=3242692 RepID=UPI00359DFDFF
MIPDEARRLWCTLAAEKDALHPATTTVVHGSRGIAPEGWTGVVRLGDAYLIEAGDADAAALDLLRNLDDPSDPEQVSSALRPARTLGPGELAYLPAGAEVAEVVCGGELREVPVASIRGWLDWLPEGDVEESSVVAMDRVLVLCRGDEVLGAAGHLDWPAGIGHVGVLVAPAARGQGVGRCLGAAATRRVLDSGRTPQWRAAAWNAASRRVARRVGYREMGRQFSFQLGSRHTDEQIGRDG